jgi:signal transduction histidine kinase
MLVRFSHSQRTGRFEVQALAVLGIVILFAGVATFVYYATLPYAGFEFVGPGRIGDVIAGSPAEAAGLQAGDQVLTLNGEPFRMGRAYLRPGQETLHLTVSRDGQVMPVEIALVPPSLKERFFTSSHLLVALIFWIVAMAVLIFKARDSVAQRFVLVTLLGVLVLAVWLLADLGLAWANMLMATVIVVFSALCVHLHTLFPERTDFRGKRLLLASVYGAGLFLLLLSNASDLAYYLHLDGKGGWLASLPSTEAVGAFFSVCVLIVLALLVRAGFVTGCEAGRRRARLVLLGTGGALLPSVVLIAIPQMFSAPYVVPTWLTLLALVLIPLSYAYAMYRRDLTKLDTGINRTAVLYLLTLALAGLYVSMSLGLARLFPHATPGIVSATDAGLFLGLVLVTNPLKDRIQVAVDRLLYGGWYNYQSFISRTSRALRDAIDVPGVSQVLERFLLGTMRFKAFVFLLADQEAGDLSLRGGVGFEDAPAIPLKGVLAHALLDSADPIDHASLCDQLSADSADSAAGRQLAAWAQAGAEAWVPLIQNKELMGLVVLGSKQADDFITQGDREILSTLAQQVAVAIGRLQLVDRLQGQFEEARALGRQILALQERNQHRLSRELHDLVLQRLIVAKMSLEGAQGRFVPESIAQVHGILLELLAYVRSITTELRGPDWEDTDLRAALEDYALKFEDHQGLPVHFQANGEDLGAPLPDELRTAVYRIFQESLTNAWKHARAQQIGARLDLRTDGVHLEVWDDGIGFEKPPHLGKQVGKGHLGLVGMRERAEEVGGTCRVESKPGKGTRVLVEIPLVA